MRDRIARRAALIALCAAALLAPAADGASSLLVLDHSIGGIALGETRARAGHGTVLSSRLDRSARPRPLRVTRVAYAGRSVVATFIGDRVGLIETRSARYRTSDGLGVGSSFADVQALGGVQCYPPGGIECQHGYRAVNRPGTTFRFDAPDGHVTFIALAYGH